MIGVVIEHIGWIARSKRPRPARDLTPTDSRSAILRRAKERAQQQGQKA